MLPAELTQYKALFLQTAWDYLRTLESSLLALQSDPHNEEAVNVLHISAHSLKSQCQVMHFTALGAMCHTLEVLFKGIKDTNRELTENDISFLIQSLDTIKESLAEISAHNREVDLAESNNALTERFGIT